jgi:hypothetical protein
MNIGTIINKEAMRNISLGIYADMDEYDNAELIGTNGKAGDMRVLVFYLQGVRVAATNGDPIWEESDTAAFVELMATEGIEL